MAKTLGVGIIGASAERGWAKLSHVPAVQQLAGLELVAGKDLIQNLNVDIVTIGVKVPDHRKLVLAALAAGKHIYCE